jgi:hypothetical protein
MNVPQRIALFIGAIVIFFMILYPPWLFVFDQPRFIRISRPVGYHSILFDHSPSDAGALVQMFSIDAAWTSQILMFTTMKIDSTRLIVQVGGTLIITGLVFLVCGRRSKV